jgi:hypothetical protein
MRLAFEKIEREMMRSADLFLAACERNAPFSVIQRAYNRMLRAETAFDAAIEPKTKLQD